MKCHEGRQRKTSTGTYIVDRALYIRTRRNAKDIQLFVPICAALRVRFHAIWFHCVQSTIGASLSIVTSCNIVQFCALQLVGLGIRRSVQMSYRGDEFPVFDRRLLILQESSGRRSGECREGAQFRRC